VQTSPSPPHDFHPLYPPRRPQPRRTAHATPTMLSRTTACRSAPRVARQQAVRPAQRRGLAAPASGSFQYQSGDAQGVKFASRDFAGPTTTLALVAKAGTRYQPLPGLTEGLQNFAFRVRHCIVEQLWGAPLTSNCHLEHRPKVYAAHRPRGRASRSPTQLVPHPREPRPRSQVPPR